MTTEGDSFTIAFHDAFDAVCWSLAMQQAMLKADWPEALLSHEKASTAYSSKADSSRLGELLFRGLRVRVAISTGRLLQLICYDEMAQCSTPWHQTRTSAVVLVCFFSAAQGWLVGTRLSCRTVLTRIGTVLCVCIPHCATLHVICQL